eukprot:GFUD01109946.1.p1 GENE.GFUD01109946.1~~GFUD01109946.1.p1  ORF type:complete len:125 (+),score=16.62 GFUD01109946.1:28-375(+)
MADPTATCVWTCINEDPEGSGLEHVQISDAQTISDGRDADHVFILLGVGVTSIACILLIMLLVIIYCSKRIASQQPSGKPERGRHRKHSIIFFNTDSNNSRLQDQKFCRYCNGGT